MDYIINNWYIFFILAITITFVVYIIYHIVNYPSDKKLLKLKEWLLYAVTEAEKNLGSGTGQIKLRYVYDMFLLKFPYLAKVITFEIFSRLVDEALEKFRELLKTNKSIAEYVKGDTDNG